jgi:hypothetical protein
MEDGGEALDYDNTQSLCKYHHSVKTRKEMGVVYRHPCGEDGWPTDPAHHVNGGDNHLPRDVIERVFPPDLKASRIPLDIVCGPPGGGKSTYARTRATDKDLIICFDTIMSEFSGQSEHSLSGVYIKATLEERNRRLASLATDTEHDKAYFIVTGIKPEERRRWQETLGGSLIMCAPPLDECIRRINADPERAPQSRRMIKVAREWWTANGDLVRPSQC